MLNLFPRLVTILPLLLVLCAIESCQPVANKISPLYNRHKFDSNVIDKLPIYDSLVTSVLENSSFFQQHINEKDSYHSFRYMPASNESGVFKKLPPEVARAIDQCFAKLGVL